MKKSALLILFVLISVLTLNVSAATLTDIEGHWAKDTIKSMVDMEIIKGYEDNTFKPENPVSKAEALILLSRVSGYSDDTSEAYIDVAYNTYSDLLSGFSTKYKDEICYLLYKGVLSESDLAPYVGDSVASEPLKRYEAAVLLTKVAGAEKSVKDKTTYEMSFSDITEIPSASKAYVDYVFKNGIMTGMGDNKFEPMYNVTRAQIATMLYRIIPALNYSYEVGMLSAYSKDNNIAKIAHEGSDAATSISVTSSINVILDGESGAQMADVPLGSAVRLTYSNADVLSIEAISPDVDETVTGVFASYDKVSDGTVINIKNPLTDEKSKYTAAETLSVTKNGKSSALAELSANSAVTLKLKNSKVFAIIAEDKLKTIVGTINKISLEPEFSISVESGNEETVYTTYDSVTVMRNGKVVGLSDLGVGDKITATLQYGILSDIVAQSATSKREGSIQEIRISITPAITVKSGDSSYEYALLRTVEITRNGLACEVYDLRVGDTATLTIEGATVTKIDLTSNSTGASITGTVKYVNSAYGYITLEESEVYIFTSKAKVQDNTGKTLTTSSVKAGVNVTVFGTEASGSYEAKLIVVN